MQEVADKLSISMSCVGKIVKRYGKSRDLKIDPSIELLVLEQHETGKSTGKIAKELGMFQSTVWRIIKRNKP